MPWEHETLRPFEFENSQECSKKGTDGFLADVDQYAIVMGEWAKSNDAHMDKIRCQQNIIKSMRCLP
jgi:hypothetical protein